MRVLLVEDDPALSAVVARVLESAGHEVTASLRGSEALSAALGSDYDLLICDLMLPDLQGTEVVRAIKSQSPELPVIVMSALSPADWEQACLDAGAARYLHKPVPLETLRREVALVESSRARLNLVLYDDDEMHARRLERSLTVQGCRVLRVGSFLDAQVHLAKGGWDFFLLSHVEGTAGAVKEAHQRGVASVVFSLAALGDEEDQLMRHGAALILQKPIDGASLLTQLRFVGPTGGF